MPALIIVILGYLLAVMAGKFVYGKNKFLGFALVAFITTLQVCLLLFYLYSMQAPVPEP